MIKKYQQVMLGKTRAPPRTQQISKPAANRMDWRELSIRIRGLAETQWSRGINNKPSTLSRVKVPYRT